MTDSQQLISEYVASGSEAAFRELVGRYLDLVYSAALRLVGGDAHLAQDVSQTVFVDLARQARSFSSGVRLGGWLHQHTCFVAAKVLRSERRRQARERQAVEMNALHDSSPVHFNHLAPLLDEAISELAEPDRTAILLRFFEQQEFRQIGAALGHSEDAARMRVTRALDKLAVLLKRRGIRSTGAALSVTLAAHAVQAAPAGLHAAIATAALTGTALSTTTAIALTKTVAMTTLQKTLIATTLAVVGGTGLYQAHQASRLRAEVTLQQQQQAPLRTQLERLQQQLEEATNQLAGLRAENAQLQSSPTNRELLKLRGEVGRWRAEAQRPTPANSSNEAVNASVKVWGERATRFKQAVDQRPDLKIPEFALLNDDDWTRMGDAAYKPETEEGLRLATAMLRLSAKGRMVKVLSLALGQYALANNGQLPSDLAALTPYITQKLDPAMLERYQLLHTGKLSDFPESEYFIGEKAPVDEGCDSIFKAGLYGCSGEGLGKIAGTSGGATWSPEAAAQLKAMQKQ